jgi:2-keto-3-deoxy-L-rhamnonate aldolase RhmA
MKDSGMAGPLLGKSLKEKMQRGQAVFGTFIQYTVNPAIVDVLPEGALDFVIVTAEHNALELADFLPLKYALAAKGIACLARTHSRDPDDVSRVCDTFDGVVVPYVEDVEHARRLAAAAIYRPLKGLALERVLPGVHAIFVGPNDLTTTMGIPNEYDHPDLIAILKRIIDVADRSHIPAGCWFGKPEQMQRTIGQGSRFVVYSNDGAFLRESIQNAFSALRNI